MYRVFAYTLMFSGLLFVVGCAGGPEAKDVPWETMGTAEVTEQTLSPFSRPIRVAPQPRMTSEVTRLQSQLGRGAVDDRIDAVNRLGRLARAGSDDSYHSIELLTRSMRTDDNTMVRMAATDALAGIQDPNSTKPLDSLVPTIELPEEPTIRFSLLKTMWQR